MTEEIHKFTKIWFLVAGFTTLSFSIAFFFLWDWFFIGIQQWPFDDPGLVILFGGAVLAFCTLNFFSFFQKKWSAVKIPLFTMLAWGYPGIIIELYIQFSIPGITNWNWFNTISYIVITLGFTLALFLQLKLKKAE